MKLETFHQKLYVKNAVSIARQKPELKFITIMLGHGDRHHTKGKRAYFKDGKLMSPDLSVAYREKNCDEAIYEGESNRRIGGFLTDMLDQDNIRYQVINKTDKDMSRRQRCRIANKAAQKFGVQHTLNIAIHSDAYEPRPDANGFSCYTSPGFTPSDIYGTDLYEEAKKMWPGETFREGRAHGMPGKEAKFTVLTETHSPSILPEFWFFTNYKNFTTHLKTPEGQRKCAQVLFNMINNFYIP